MNGHRVCQHEGGFTPFDCEVTGTIRDGANFVIIAVDSTRRADGVPATQTDWYNDGGLTRDVSLVELPQAFVDDYDMHLDRNADGEISGSVHLVGATAGAEVRISIPDAKVAQTARTDQNGTASFRFHAQGLELWSPEHPKLYQVRIDSALGVLTDEVGFRTVEVRGTDILLNGKPVFLRGISLHAEAPIRTGRACADHPDRNAFLTTLVQETHRQDPTRPVTAALLTPPLIAGKRMIDDPLAEILDAIRNERIYRLVPGQARGR